MSNTKKYGLLIGSFFIYALTFVFTKLASMQLFLSWQYVLLLLGAVGVLGVYAILWQQILRRMPIADAFMWKGTAIVWAMLFGHVFFNEPIAWNNVVGAMVIISGIVLYAYADRKETSDGL